MTCLVIEQYSLVFITRHFLQVLRCVHCVLSVSMKSETNQFISQAVLLNIIINSATSEHLLCQTLLSNSVNHRHLY